MAALEKIIDTLPELDDVALNEIEKRISFLRKAAKSTGADTDAVVTDLDAKVTLDAIVATLQRLGLPSYKATRLEDRKDRDAFASKTRHLNAFLRRHGFAAKSERMFALKLGYYLLARSMRAERQEVSFNTLVAQSHRVVERINDEFPGYAQAGMLRFILRSNRAA
jgi:hypothetical protein